MTPAARRLPNANDLELAVHAKLSSVNAVFTLSLILTQASSPGQVICAFSPPRFHRSRPAVRRFPGIRAGRATIVQGVACLSAKAGLAQH